MKEILLNLKMIVQMEQEFYNIGVIEREGKRDELAISQLLFEKTYFTENYMDFIDQTFEVSEIIGNIYENPELLGGKHE